MFDIIKASRLRISLSRRKKKMIKVIVYTNKFNKTSARLVADFGYRKVVLSWDIQLCAEVLKCSVAELLNAENGEYIVK